MEIEPHQHNNVVCLQTGIKEIRMSTTCYFVSNFVLFVLNMDTV